MKAENIIYIAGASEADVRKAIKEYIVKNPERIKTNDKFALFEHGWREYHIKLDDRIDTALFIDFIKLLVRRKGDDNYIVEGYITTRKKPYFPDVEAKKRIFIFSEDPDNQKDILYAVTEDNKGYKIDAEGNITRTEISRNYKEFPVEILNDLIQSDIAADKDIAESEKDLASVRVRHLILAVLTAYFLNFFLIKAPAAFLIVHFGISMILWGWLLLDYKLLQHFRHYLGLVILSIAIVLYGYFISRDFVGLQFSRLALIGSALPITFLVFQRPVRWIFKKIFSREPVIQNPSPSLVDLAYIFILALLSVAVPVLLVSVING